ncbi:hypothetical protein ACHHYP_12024 [Achlya hypogyna]|uniref:WRKY transcription factor 19 n=1 Tax=Achlya hypogyna TaxID=1202772 RepID=A0A1V9YHS5_ACHHY|nr:hypothetical protein ACHHYP_12024 [Achlya hypogyna]
MAHLEEAADVDMFWGDSLDFEALDDAQALTLVSDLFGSQPTALPDISQTSLLDLLTEDADCTIFLDLDKPPLPPVPTFRPRKLCATAGCAKAARVRGLCTEHGGRRICSEPGCPRVPQVGQKCSTHGGYHECAAVGCGKRAQSKGLCKTHGGGMRCQATGCSKAVTSQGRCRAHGGGTRCTIAGCGKWAQHQRLCTAHFRAL